jgi:uncharacterized protein
MYVKEIWRYPVKSMAGERLNKALVGPLGIQGDRTILVSRRGKIVTARTDHKLLGLKGTLSAEGKPQVSGHHWESDEALTMVKGAAGPDAELISHNGPERFDVLPLLVSTDGAIEAMSFDGRRLRPNIVIGGVDGHEERSWPGRHLAVGGLIIYAAQLRGRCVMTTYDPDTLKQDLGVLKRIVKELDGRMALDCVVVTPGDIEEGAPVSLLNVSL